MIEGSSPLFFVGLSSRSGPGQIDDAAPRFRAGVKIIQIDATVLDKNGKPVRGLTTDFRVLEVEAKASTVEPRRRQIRFHMR